MRVLVIDNYDSFTYNLVQYLGQLGAEVEIWRNDDPRFGRAGWEAGFDGVLVSPGPGTPEAAGVCVDVIREFGAKLPIFGELNSTFHTRKGRPDRSTAALVMVSSMARSSDA